MTNLSRNRAEQIIDAYGANPHRWPDQERAELLKLAERDEQVRLMLNEAKELDAFLDEMPALHASEGLAGHLSAIPEKNRLGWLRALWPFGEMWQPALTFASAALVGVWLGVSNPALLDPTLIGMSTTVEAPEFGILNDPLADLFPTSETSFNEETL